MDTQTAGLLGLCYALVKIVEKILDQKYKKVPYREDFMERLGVMMEAHTNAIKEFREHQQRIEPIILATDENLTPRLWPDKGQAKRTHDAVGNLVDITEEMGKSVSEIHRKVIG